MKKERSNAGQAWERLKKNKLAMFGLVLIVFATLIAVLGGMIRPDPSPDANEQNPSLGRKKPGFSAQFLKIRKNRHIEQEPFWELMFFGGKPRTHRAEPIEAHSFQGANILVKKPMTSDLVPYNLADVLYPLDLSHSYREVKDGKLIFHTLEEGRKEVPLEELRERVKERNLETRTYYLGTDSHGRDILSRLMAGTIVSLSVGLISVAISVLIGVTMGSIAGFYKGWVDDVVMWVINVIWSVPALLLVIGVTLALGKGFTNIFLAVGLVMWVEVARIVRGQVLGVREKEFVEAGRALGYGSGRLILRHIIPNVMGPVIVMSAANFASAILIEAGLSFLGIGAQPPMASWGGMIKKNYSLINDPGMEYLAILPGICIMLLVLAFMLVGNGLRDAFDTKALDEEISTGA